MNEKHNFRYDPLYRIIDEIEEMRIVEGKLKSLYDRLKRINNLGLIPEVFEMARYPKYEHGIGTLHQINSLLDVTDGNIIPSKYRRPLILASLFLHLGHFPYTYSTERTLLLASNLGHQSKENEIKKYVERKIEKVLNKMGLDDERKRNILDNIFSLRDYKLLYRYFSAEILVEKWGNLKDKINGLSEEDLEVIIKDLVDKENDGYRYLSLADKADFVQRDALYFGTVRIDVSPKHLYSGISRYNPIFSLSEERLIEYNFNYLTERFYDNSIVICFSRLYEKIVASLIISKNFKLEWIEKYDDAQFKRLICDGIDSNNNRTRLPSTWLKRAKDLFEKGISFSPIFDLKGVFFQKEKDVIDIEYELIGKRESKRGLLTYPFDIGILLAVDYLDKDKLDYPVHPNYQAFSVRVFQDDSNRSLEALLSVIKNLSHYLSFSHVDAIRRGLANQLSWTKEVRFSNEAVISSISEAIQSIESDKYDKGDFIEKYLKNLSNISTFGESWHNLDQFFWKGLIDYFLKQHRRELEKGKIYELFTKGLLSLPVRLLQYKSTRRYLDEIYDKLLEKISSDVSNDKKGDFFEALWLINRMRTKRGKFQFFLNGMVVVDPDRPRKTQDQNEFDVIEFLINDTGKAECWIYACSIADDYESRNRDQITKLSDHVHGVFPNLIIRTRYIIPKDKNTGDWAPREEDAGRNYNQM